MRGLKSIGVWTNGEQVSSHLSRGAWIEMSKLIFKQEAIKVAPLTGCVD
ncbi:protein of unknown function [Ruminococcaceae bacterium BL-4]|nr:protein of unknown function [Ruminococcaceae bacterium BL-4]